MTHACEKKEPACSPGEERRSLAAARSIDRVIRTATVKNENLPSPPQGSLLAIQAEEAEQDRLPSGVNIEHDAEGADRATVLGNVTAAVNAEPDFTSTSQGALPAGRLGETRRVRVRGADIGLDTELAKNFVTDCARNVEGLKSDRELQEDWGLDKLEWGLLAENTALLGAIRADGERRIQNGDAAREAAQRHFAKAPSVLNEILQNETISPRHRIEAAKELRQVAGGARENTASGDKFVIMIDLGEDQRLMKEFDWSTRTPDDGDAQ